MPPLTCAAFDLWLSRRLMGFQRFPGIPIPSHTNARKCSHLPFRLVGSARRIQNASYTVHEVTDEDSFEKPHPTPAQEAPESTLPSPDPPFLIECGTCNNTGFVPCPKCNAEGFIRNPRSVNVFYCPDCVGYKKLRCPKCGGKCYLCD